MKIPSFVVFFAFILLAICVRAESIHLTHGKDATPDFMQALVTARYLGNGYISKDGLPEAKSQPILAKDHEIYFYSVPESQLINDGQGFELVVDKTQRIFWVMVSGGMGNTNHVFGPGVLP